VREISAFHRTLFLVFLTQFDVRRTAASASRVVSDTFVTVGKNDIKLRMTLVKEPVRTQPMQPAAAVHFPVNRQVKIQHLRPSAPGMYG